MVILFGLLGAKFVKIGDSFALVEYYPIMTAAPWIFISRSLFLFRR